MNNTTKPLTSGRMYVLTTSIPAHLATIFKPTLDQFLHLLIAT